MRFSNNFVKMMVIGGLAVISSSVLATGGNVSILNNLSNQAAVNNASASVSAMTKGSKGSKNDNGNKGSKGGDSYGDKGGHNPPPSCVPEPCSMLAMGLGAGVMAIKRRRAAKNA